MWDCGVGFRLWRHAGEEDRLSDVDAYFEVMIHHASLICAFSGILNCADTIPHNCPVDHRITTPMQDYAISPWNG
jgi:hypothetical protein